MSTFTGAATQEVTTVAGVDTGHRHAMISPISFSARPTRAPSVGNATNIFEPKTRTFISPMTAKSLPQSASLALRWEFTSPITELYNRLVNRSKRGPWIYRC